MDRTKNIMCQRTYFVEENRSIVAHAEKLGRELTADEQKLFDTNDRRIEQLDAELANISTAPIPGSRRQIQPLAPGGNPPARQQRLSATPQTDDPSHGFRSPRDFLTSVMAAFQTGDVDPRLQSLAAGSDEHRIISDPAGGFLVPTSFGSLMTIPAEADPLASRVMAVQMSTSTLKIPARVDKDHSSSVSGGVRFYRKAETVAATPSQLSFEQVELVASTLMGASYATEELLQDSPQAFAQLLNASFAEEFGGTMVNERLFGTGIGEFLGVMNSPCLVSVAKETGQAAATISYQNVVKMRSRCWGYDRAIWLANHDTMPQLMTLSQVVGVGGAPVWQPSAREDHPDLLLGRPIYFTEYAKTLGTTGDLILGNWSQYLEGTLQPLNGAESIHVRFLNHERTFKFWTRNAGAPWWRAALTPKNSSTTLSPFVALATRG